MGDERAAMPWLYFGCPKNDTGHYLCGADGTKAHLYGGPLAYLREMNWDGVLTPYPVKTLYVASLSRLGGWGYSALSWWDCSKDPRPGSNSTVLAPHMNIDPAIFLEEAAARMPWVFDRLPKPLELWSQP